MRSNVVELAQEVDSKLEEEVVRNLTILGRGECGKSSILYRLMKGKFDPDVTATPLESETLEFSVDSKKVELKIFDTSGQDDYARFRTLTLPISDYALVCYSVEDPISFSEIEDTIISLIKSKAPPHVKIILCAAKIDLRREDDKTTEEGLLLAEQIGAVGFFECSSATGEGVAQIFDFIKNDIYVSLNYRAPEPSNERSLFSRLFNCCGFE